MLAIASAPKLVRMPSEKIDVMPGAKDCMKYDRLRCRPLGGRRGA